MPPEFTLQPVPAEPDRARLQSLETELTQREAELTNLTLDLQALQAKYLDHIGALYAELSTLEGAVAEEEVRQGLRLPPDPDEAEDETESSAGSVVGGCGNRSAPSDELKRVFRDLAKAVHPDLAMNDPARYRRHSLMAEANRAYAERDADRLRLILRAWEHSPDAVVGDDAASDQVRLQRRLGEVGDRLIEINATLADLRASAISRLRNRIDDARSQGWDLFAEMKLQVKRDIARASARLAKLRRQAISSPQGRSTPQ